jgi:hypothetical protein
MPEVQGNCMAGNLRASTCKYVVFCLSVTEVRLPHRVETHDRLAPDRRVDSPPLDGEPGEFLGGEISVSWT